MYYTIVCPINFIDTIEIKLLNYINIWRLKTLGTIQSSIIPETAAGKSEKHQTIKKIV